MSTTLMVTTEIPSNREVRFTLPDDIPEGPAEITLIVKSKTECTSSTLGDLAASEFFGMWRDRADKEDSVEIAQRLRAEAWKRTA